MRNSPGITQAEIARRLGIHQTTVSAILDGKRAGRYSAGMRDKVRSAASRLGYRPSAPARVLRGARSGWIGVFHFGRDKDVESERLHEIVSAVHGAGYVPLAMPMGSSVMWVEQDAGSACSVMLDARVEGLVLSGFADEFDLAQLKRFRAAGIPIVGVSGLKLPGIPLYAADREQAVHDATAHLISNGRRELVYLCRWPSASEAIAGARDVPGMKGFRRAAEEQGLAPQRAQPFVEPSPLQTGLNAFESGHTVFKRIWEGGARPDGVVCYDDGWALGVYAYCQRHGIQIPGDVAVVGFENQLFGEHLVPSLTSVALPHAEMARTAVENLLKVMRGDGKETRNGGKLFPGQLVVRESCGTNTPAVSADHGDHASTGVLELQNLA